MTAGCSWPACPTDSAADEHLGAAARVPRQVLSGAQRHLDAAGAGDDPHRLERVGGLDRPARAPRPARFAQAGQHRTDVHAADAAGRRRARRSRRRWAGGRSGCSSTARVSRASAAPPGRCANSATSAQPRETLRDNASSRPGSSVVASCGRSASSGLSTVGGGAARVVGGQAPLVEDPGGQERCRQHLDVAVTAPATCRWRGAASGPGVRPRPGGRGAAAPTGSCRGPPVAAPPRPGRRAAEVGAPTRRGDGERSPDRRVSSTRAPIWVSRRTVAPVGVAHPAMRSGRSTAHAAPAAGDQSSRGGSPRQSVSVRFDGAAGDLGQQRGAAVECGHRDGGVDGALVAAAGLADQMQPALRARHRRRIPDRGLQQHVGGAVATSVVPAPITPPMAAVATSSTISTSPGSSLRSTSSRVTTVSPGSANRTVEAAGDAGCGRGRASDGRVRASRSW